ncbi:MAG TPA: Gfo/Idh/MocA family oxidoreductase [Agriterribacter sp.]|nr:Gfo/Idh/MocA family oxidoreductase [Agriterribacter sp.]
MERRHFIGSAVMGTLGVSLSNTTFPGAFGAGNKLVLALIGCGSRGLSVLSGIVTENKDVEVKYLCDVNETLVDVGKAIASYTTLQGYAPKFVGDMKQVLDDKDVDAVVIATPEHWHTLATIWSLQAGKHVFVEKNPTISIWEGRKMVEAGAKYKKVLQIGFENRSAPYAFTARDYIKSGKLGNIVHVKCYNMLSGSRWMAKPDTEVPQGLNWNAWLGPAKQVPYNPNRHSMTGRGGWLDFWDYGGGALSDDASHVMDLARLALGDPGHPTSVYCSGGNIAFHSQKETPEFLNITYDWGTGFAMTCESGNFTSYMQKIPGEIRFSKTEFPFWPQTSTRIEIYGTDRLMYLGRHGGGWQVVEKDGKVVDSHKDIFPDKVHQKNFVDAIRLGATPNGDVLQGHLSASLVHLADICYRTGNKQLLFDSDKERFLNSDSANTLLKGNYRAPYIVPENV